jgi:ribonuclease HIII
MERSKPLPNVPSACDNPSHATRMAQDTLVLKLGPAEQARLVAALEGQAFDFRSVPHARFSAKGEGVVATLYTSGKLVVQGADPRAFLLRYVGGAGEAAASGGGGLEAAAGQPLVGSDEAGKGDYFGPLVVCALRLPPDRREALARSGVTDSKRLTDETVLRLAPALEETFDHRVEVLDPPAYNDEHARVKNLNPMLADLHARAIRATARPGDHVLVDRFAKESLVAERVRDLEIELHQRTRAESEPAVAAASVVARAVFLRRLRALSEEHAVDLHKGAGAPTDRAARDFVRLHGFERLGAVAKLHFKNTSKIPGHA